jgi:hypothetical protein
MIPKDKVQTLIDNLENCDCEICKDAYSYYKKILSKTITATKASNIMCASHRFKLLFSFADYLIKDCFADFNNFDIKDLDDYRIDLVKTDNDITEYVKKINNLNNEEKYKLYLKLFCKKFAAGLEEFAEDFRSGFIFIVTRGEEIEHIDYASNIEPESSIDILEKTIIQIKDKYS